MKTTILKYCLAICLVGIVIYATNMDPLEQRINKLEARMNALNQSNTIPREVDYAFNNRGFSKTIIDTGKVTLNSKGIAHIVIPNATATSVVAGSSVTGLSDFGISLTQAYVQTVFGGSTSQFDITNTAGSTYRYTYDGTGTDPNITAARLPVNSNITIDGQNFNTANNGSFTVTGSGANYFEVTNASGVAENDKTLGTLNPAPLVGGPAMTGKYWVNIRYGTGFDDIQYIVITNASSYKDSTF